MSDAELRRLERSYHQNSSPENLFALNTQRVRAGLDPIRIDPRYLRQWALDIYDITKSNDEFIPLEEFLGPNEPAYEDSFTGHLPFYEKKETPIVMVNVEMYARSSEQAAGIGDSMVINLEPLHDALSYVRAWQVRAILSNEIVTVLIPRPAPPDWGLRTPYEEFADFRNRFLSAQELLDYLMGIYRQEVKAKWKSLLQRIGDARSPWGDVLQPMGTSATLTESRMWRPSDVTGAKNQFINILEVANILRKKKWFLSHSTPVMDYVIQTRWFQEALGSFADSAEKELRRHDLIFDLEYQWPVAAIFDGSHYVLTLETGYNDTIDPEEFDASEPEGARYGDVDQFMEQISRELGRVSGTDWNVEWEYEDEYEKGSEDIAIAVKAQTPLTYELLLHLLK